METIFKDDGLTETVAVEDTNAEDMINGDTVKVRLPPMETVGDVNKDEMERGEANTVTPLMPVFNTVVNAKGDAVTVPVEITHKELIA